MKNEKSETRHLDIEILCNEKRHPQYRHCRIGKY